MLTGEEARKRMPIREYEADDPRRGCEHCRTRFERLEDVKAEPLRRCPECGGDIRRAISAPTVGSSKSGFDDRAKSAGFHKLKKTGKGEYEKQY